MSTKKSNHSVPVAAVTALGIAGHIMAHRLWLTINLTLSFGGACPEQLQQAVEGARPTPVPQHLNVDFC